MNTPCKRLASALHAACVALEEVRNEVRDASTIEHAALELETTADPHWTDKIGRHVALAVAAMPDSVLRAWLMDGSVIGGFDSIYVITCENGHWGVKARSSFAP